MIGHVAFVPARATDANRGLLGFVRLRYGHILLDGLTVRRTVHGQLAISWPARRSRRRRTAHAVVRPANDAARCELEREILGRLREQGDVA